jgi:uncharacterized protein (DUF885 family)
MRNAPTMTPSRRSLVVLCLLLPGVVARAQSDGDGTADRMLGRAATTWQATIDSLADWESRVSREDDIEGLGRLYIELLLETDPVNGMLFGVHGTDEDPSWYDDRLPDASGVGWGNRKLAHAFLRGRLAAIDPGRLSPEDQVDFRILEHRVALRMFEMSQLQAHWDPLTYVSGRANAFAGLGTAFSRLLLRDYAPLEQRLRSFGRRCSATPRYFSEVREVLSDEDRVLPSAVSKEIAISRLEAMAGASGLFRDSLPRLLGKSSLSASEQDTIRGRCAEAVDAIEEFAAWLKSEVLPRPDGAWRLGAAAYGRKYALYMDYPLGPGELLAAAEAALAETGAALVATGRAIHDVYLADAIESGDLRPAAELDDAAVVGNVFARMAKDRSTPESLIPDSYAMADSIVAFVDANDLLDLPPTTKMRIEEIPPYLSGYAVAQIVTAPPFEPDLPSVWYWDLPLLRTDPGFLKEYNRPALAEVYIHEGVPGHFVQIEYSNRSPRVIPRVFRNGPMVEGWASYIQTQLVDLGFTVYPDSPIGREIQFMADRKLVLRTIINAIIDIRLHTTDWPEDDAVKLMVERGFQEPGEADAKLTRVKLSSVQLATYFAGHRAILEILDEYRRRQGDDFSWKAFNERLVTAGSPPFFALRERMLGVQ